MSRIPETFSRHCGSRPVRSPNPGGSFTKAGGKLGGDRRSAWNFPAGGLGAFFLNPLTFEAQFCLCLGRAQPMAAPANSLAATPSGRYPLKTLLFDRI